MEAAVAKDIEVMSISDRDAAVIWHPYTQMKTAGQAMGIVKAKDALLTNEAGEELIDANSSWWVNIHGHANNYIAKRVKEQLDTLEHVIFAGFTHEPAVQLAERLLPLLPGEQARMFYSDNGSTAVEVALKMAMQYWANNGTDKREIVALSGSYHGDTFGAMSVSERTAFTAPFQKYLFDVHLLPQPNDENTDDVLADLEDRLSHGRIAAVILEPLLMGVAGMHIYGPEVLEGISQLCKKHDVLLIVDEVFTGFGRTGKWFATHHAKGVMPDMVCLSKGLTGGTMALGVTTCTQDIYDAFLSDDKSKTLFHGHSFTANPVACSASLASLDLMEKPETWQQIAMISEMQETFKEELSQNQVVSNARSIGTLLAFEVAMGEENSYFHNLRDKMYDHFLKAGVVLRPLGNTLYILPPYCITEAQLTQVYDAIRSLLRDLED